MMISDLTNQKETSETVVQGELVEENGGENIVIFDELAEADSIAERKSSYVSYLSRRRHIHSFCENN